MEANSTSIQEQQAIRKAIQGDQRAFTLLYDMHVTPLFRFLKQFASEESEVEEWVQRSFIKAFASINSFREQSRFSSWIFRIGINEMRMDKRKRAPDDRLDDETAGSVAEQETFEWSESMKQWLEGITDRQRIVFILYEVEGFSHAEISEMLEIGESHSRTLLTRTKAYLRQCLQKELRS